GCRGRGRGAGGPARARERGRPRLAAARAAGEPGGDAALALSSHRARDRRGARHAPAAAAGHRDPDREGRGGREAPARGRRHRARGAPPRPRPQAIEPRIAKVEEAERRLRAGAGIVPARPASTQGSLLDAPAPTRPTLSPPGRGQGEGSRASAPAAPPAPQPLTPTLSPGGKGSEPAGDLGEAWQRVVAGVLARKALLGSVLQHATPIAVRDGVLAINL